MGNIPLKIYQCIILCCSKEKDTMEGNRIVDAKFFIEQILSFPHCELFSCSSQNVKILKENRKGLISEFVLECSLCKVNHIVSTCKKDGKMNAKWNGCVRNHKHWMWLFSNK